MIEKEEKAYFSAENLRKTFDSAKIDVSFSCGKNSMTAIVGPSGSGKSTVLRMIAGLETPDEGKDEGNGTRIELDGRRIETERPSRRGLGMVSQSPSLFEHLTVEDNVSYGLVSAGMKKKLAREKANEFLKKFNLEGFGKRYPDTLSGGEAQRVSLARTLIMKPKLVLFDEPLSALDAPLRKKLAALIRDLQKAFGFTGIMVTHDIEEAKSICDKVVLIEKGKIKWEGNPEDFGIEKF
nr:ABC transporter ATP-binding protein [Treponema sp.]